MSLLLASGVHKNTFVLVRILSCLALFLAWSNAAVMAQPGFLLGSDYSEWLYPTASNVQIATDGSGAVYILSVFLSSPPVFRVTKLSADGKTILWENDLGFQSSQMAVDPSGGVYVLSSLSTFLAGVPPAPSLFVAKLTADGSGIAWKTQVPNLPPFSPEPVLAVDLQGRAYVTGESDTSNEIGSVVRLKADGSGIDYISKVAGYPTAIAVDASGGAFVAGSPASYGASNTFLARLAPDGSAGFYLTLPAAIFGITVAVDPQGNAVTYSGTGNEGGVLQRFDPTGAVTLSQPGPKSYSPALAVDAAGNMYVTGSNQYLTPVRNSLATCGMDLLSVFAPDGAVLQTTYIPGGFNSGALVAIGVNSNVFVVDRAQAGITPGFTPSQTGPFPPVPPANPSYPTTPFLWRLSHNANAQTFPLACLGNAATYHQTAGVVAPGMMLSLFGSGLGPQQGIQTQATLQSPFPTQAGNVEVTFDGKPAPLLWVQDAQINAVTPWSLTPGQTTEVCVSYQNVKTNCLTVPVAQSSPGVFTIDGVYAAALNQDGTVNSADHPAPVGSIISVMATGLGPIDPAQGDGTLVGFPLPTNTAQVTVQAIDRVSPIFGLGYTIVTPFVVTYAGPAPYLVAGTTQINFQVVKYQGTIYAGSGYGFQIYVAQ